MAEKKGMRNGKVRIYVVFLSAGHAVGYDAYKRYHPEVKIPENEDILSRIKKECKDVEFLGKSEPVRAEDVITAIKREKESLDGLLVFGGLTDEIIQEGLPAVTVSRPLEGCTTVPFHSYKGKKVLTSIFPAHYDKNPEVYSRRIKDIAEKIRLIDTISKMKGMKVLVATDLPPLGYFEPMNMQFVKDRKEYEETYMANLKKTFGMDFVTITQKELFDKMRGEDEKKAKDIARMWISRSMGVRGTNESEITKSAKLYLAMKGLMEEYDCGAVTVEGFGYPPIGYQGCVEQDLPSAGLGVSQLLTDGIAAATETLTDCLITQQLALFFTGSGGLLGDYNIDPINNTSIVCHCEGTLKPYKDRGLSPFVIRNLPFFKENEGGAGVETQYPIGETVTVVKISMYAKKLSLFTGQTVSGDELFPYWADILGRNKVAVKTDAKALLDNVDWVTFGNHRVAFFGDWRQQFKDLAKLIGYEVVEKDRIK
jgi:L-fucose isomerase-like protein